MKRAIVTAAPLSAAALAELKDWLGITTTGEDAILANQLRAATETCEAFTGTMPLEADCEEVLPVSSDWQLLETRPVLAITGAWDIDSTGARHALPSTAYALDFRADGLGCIRILDPGTAGRVAVRFTAGLSADWSALPEGLRHGIMRLAAHQYRVRETSDKVSVPPAAVVALWRPWRRVRLL